MGTEYSSLARRLHGVLLCVGSLFALASALPAQSLANHRAVYDEHGILVPWTPWRDAIQREVNWYLNCLVENG